MANIPRGPPSMPQGQHSMPQGQHSFPQGQPSFQQAKVITGGQSEWQNGLFGCFNNCGLCIITFIFPCYTAGRVAESVGESCPLCCLVTFVPIVSWYFFANIRGKVRDSKGIEGGFLTDCCIMAFCVPCGLVQEGQEMGVMSQGQSIARE